MSLFKIYAKCLRERRVKSAKIIKYSFWITNIRHIQHVLSQILIWVSGSVNFLKFWKFFEMVFLSRPFDDQCFRQSLYTNSIFICFFVYIDNPNMAAWNARIIGSTVQRGTYIIHQFQFIYNLFSQWVRFCLSNGNILFTINA